MTEITRIDGSPGAGKTHTLKQYLKRERDDRGVELTDFRFITFTNAATDDAVDEVVEVYDAPRADIENSVRTLHSAALGQVLREGIIDEPNEQIITHQKEKGKDPGLYRGFANRNGMGYYGRGLKDGREKDAQTGAADALFRLNDWLTLTQKPAENARQAPFPLPWPAARAADLLERWDDFKKTARQRPVYEHGDYLDVAIENELFPDADVLLIDEFQDFSPQEYLYYRKWRDSGDLERVYLAGDPNQCIPEGTPVQTPEGPVPIEEISKGDEVMSAYADGEAGSFEVTATHDRPADGPVVSLITGSGATVSCTRNHELFAALPNQRQSNGDVADRHFVYVMKSAAGDYRVGITQMPRKRFTVEQGASAMMIVGAHETEEKALLEEKQIAYKYGIPQTPFKTRGGLPQSMLSELYDGLDTRTAFHALCEDKGLDADRFHIVGQSDDTTNSEYQVAGERVRVALKLGQIRERKNRSDYVYHTARAVTANDDAIEELRKTPLKESDAKADGSVRFRLMSSDYMKVREAADEAVDALHEAGIGADLCEEATYGSFDESGGRRVPLSVVPASQVTEGMYLPVVSDGSVEYEQVVDRTEREASTTVYDLTVPPTHNYVVGADRGVAVHNSIYSFRAGSPYYFNETDADVDEFLSKSYRCRGEIAAFARQVLNGGPGADTDFRAAFDGGRVERVDATRDVNLENVIGEALHYDDGAFLLARTNRKVRSVKRWLESNGYPYRILGKRWKSVWDKGLKSALAALRSLARGVGGVPRAGASVLMAHTPQSDLRRSLLEEHGDIYTAESVWSAYSDTETVGQLVEKLDYSGYKRKALKAAALRSGRNAPNDLKIGTVHAAKGLERPAVLLFNSFNGFIQQQYNEDMDIRAEEHRIAYVGATRAKKRLYVVNGFFDGPAMEPVKKALRKGVEA